MVGHSFDFSELNGSSHFLGQCLQESVHFLQSVFPFHLFFGRLSAVEGVGFGLLEGEVGVFFGCQFVEREVSADGHAESFEVVHRLHFFSLCPNAEERVLSEVFRILPVRCDAQRQPEDFVLEREQVVSEI